MLRAASRTWLILVVIAAALALMAGGAQAQSTATLEKSFEIIEVDGNVVVVKEADGTHEYTLPADFRFKVGGKQLPLSELKPGMKGKATITTTTTVKPVVVTEVRNGVVMKNIGAGTVIVRTGDTIKMFSQGEIDKRGVRVYREGKPVLLSDLRQGDKLTATFITEGQPQLLTEKQVEATIAAAAAAPAAAAPASTSAATAAGAPATTPDTTAAAAGATAPTTAPAGTETAEGGSSWLMWGALILVVVIVVVFLFRRSGN